MYILDTSTISAARRPDRAPRIAAWLRGKAEADLFLSVISLGEIGRGIRAQEVRNPALAADLQAWLERALRMSGDRILPFGASDGVIWGGCRRIWVMPAPI